MRPNTFNQVDLSLTDLIRARNDLAIQMCRSPVEFPELILVYFELCYHGIPLLIE